MLNIPKASIDLIELLDKTYPPVAPRPDMLEKEIMYKAGQRDVVETLKTQMKLQLEEEEEKVRNV